MKNSHLKASVVVLLGSILFANTPALAESASSVRTRQMQITVVAEQFGDKPVGARASADKPVHYVASDGGYIEGGEPMAGETPPLPSAVAEALKDALSAQGYQPALASQIPALIITYHWGVLRSLGNPWNTPAGIDPNLRARLSLVAPLDMVRRIEEEISMRMTVISPFNMLNLSSNRQALELANDARYFVIVSAYDYAAFGRGETNAVWRV
jgi:hypothetical protein